MTDWIYTLQSPTGSRALFTRRGCALVALQIAGKSGSLTDVVLGYETPAAYSRDPFFMGRVAGRVAGRIPAGRLMTDDEETQLNTDEHGVHLHGGPKGLGTREWLVEQQGDQQIEFAYTSPHGEQGYPGTVQIRVAYSLSEADELRVRYRAESDVDTVVSPTQHSYFNLAGHNAGNVLEHTVQINADYFVPLQEDLMPSNQLAPVAATAMDFRQPQALGSQIDAPEKQVSMAGGYDHSWILGRREDWAERPAVVVRHPASGHQMAVYTDRPAVHLYSGNMLGTGIAGKHGARYGCRSGLCLETQHSPVSAVSGQWENAFIGPGRLFESETRFAFSGF